MKNSIKLLIVVFASIMATESYAQTFGFRAGLNLSNMLLEDDEDTYSDDFKFNPGFHIGPTAEFLIGEMISFETALLLSTKGYIARDEYTIMGEDFEAEENLKLFYLDIPLTAKVSFEVGSAEVFGLFGPYLGMGLSGNSKSEVTWMGESETGEEDVKWGPDEEEDNFRRLDYGLTVGAGVEINAIQIGLTYGLGLANIASYTDEGSKINNRVLGLSLGYRFTGK